VRTKSRLGNGGRRGVTSILKVQTDVKGRRFEMKMFDLIFKIAVLLAALLIIIAALMSLVFGESGESVQPTQYEYKVESPSDSELVSSLNTWGTDGWTVVSARRATSGSGYSTTASYEMILMREK
jgi:hypothetical protein